MDQWFLWDLWCLVSGKNIQNIARSERMVLKKKKNENKASLFKRYSLILIFFMFLAQIYSSLYKLAYFFLWQPDTVIHGEYDETLDDTR